MSRTANLMQEFIVLKPDLSAQSVAVTASLYQQLDQDFDRFRGHSLVAMYHFDQDWGSWERHPAGDETVILLHGKVRMRLRRNGKDEVHELASPGDSLIVPQGLWHTAEVLEAARMLFITPGEGTEQKAGD